MSELYVQKRMALLVKKLVAMKTKSLCNKGFALKGSWPASKFFVCRESGQLLNLKVNSKSGFFNHLFHMYYQRICFGAAAVCIFYQFTASWLMYKNKRIDNSLQQRPERSRECTDIQLFLPVYLGSLFQKYNLSDRNICTPVD